MTTSPTSSTSWRDVKRLGLPDLAFIGKAGAGKSSAASLLNSTDAGSYVRLSFASPLKTIAKHIWGAAAFNDRDKLQKLGVAVREIDEDAWVRLFETDWQSIQAPVCVDDCRFPNEYWCLKGLGFKFVRIEAPRALRIDRLRAIGKLQDEAQLDHISETSIDELPADYVIQNDGGEWDLMDELFQILKREHRR